MYRKTKKKASTIIQATARRRSATRKASQCSICLNIVKEKQEILKPCNHIFHPKCIEEWTLRSLDQSEVAKCPLCRSQYDLTFLKKRLIMKLNYKFIEKQYEILEKKLTNLSKKQLTHEQYVKQIIYEIAINYYKIILLTFNDINEIS